MNSTVGYVVLASLRFTRPTPFSFGLIVTKTKYFINQRKKFSKNDNNQTYQFL